MVVKKFSEMQSSFSKAIEIWVAVALMKDSGYNIMQRSLNPTCKQHYLVGIDLPTEPEVLRALLAKLSPNEFEASIYKAQANFHPKVYLIKMEESYVAYIGSSNLTQGGLENNIELNYGVTNQEDCMAILNWFNELKSESFPLTEENISIYEDEYSNIKNSEEQNKTRRKSIQLKKVSKPQDFLDQFNFENSYFIKEHHNALRKEIWSLNTGAANAERKKVTKRLTDLHEEIFSKFSENGLGNIHPNNAPHLISLDYQLNEDKPRPLSRMWLSYGKSQIEIKKYHELFPKASEDEEDDLQSFINHARLQVAISYTEVGIWLLFGKENNGSLFDRQYFRDQMKNPSYREEFFREANALPLEFWIEVGGQEKRKLKSFSNPDELWEYCKKDNLRTYFIIGRDYKISNPEISITSMPLTTLSQFKVLYPLYFKMRDKRFLK